MFLLGLLLCILCIFHIQLRSYKNIKVMKTKIINFQKVCFEGIFGCIIHYLFGEGFLGKGETITVSGKEPS